MKEIVVDVSKTNCRPIWNDLTSWIVLSGSTGEFFTLKYICRRWYKLLIWKRSKAEGFLLSDSLASCRPQNLVDASPAIASAFKTPQSILHPRSFGVDQPKLQMEIQMLQHKCWITADQPNLIWKKGYRPAPSWVVLLSLNCHTPVEIPRIVKLPYAPWRSYVVLRSSLACLWGNKTKSCSWLAALLLFRVYESVSWTVLWRIIYFAGYTCFCLEHIWCTLQSIRGSCKIRLVASKALGHLHVRLRRQLCLHLCVPRDKLNVR